MAFLPAVVLIIMAMSLLIDVINDIRATLATLLMRSQVMLRASKWVTVQRHAQHCRHFQIERGNPVSIFVGDDFRERA